MRARRGARDVHERHPLLSLSDPSEPESKVRPLTRVRGTDMLLLAYRINCFGVFWDRAHAVCPALVQPKIGRIELDANTFVPECHSIHPPSPQAGPQTPTAYTAPFDTRLTPRPAFESTPFTQAGASPFSSSGSRDLLLQAAPLEPTPLASSHPAPRSPYGRAARARS